MLTFDRGEWSYRELSAKFVDALDSVDPQVKTLQCGHWMIHTIGLRGHESLRLLSSSWQYKVFVEGPSDKDGELMVWESMLVRDFPSLLQLFALIRSAALDVEQPS